MTVRWRGHHHFDRISVDDLVGYGVQVKGLKYYCDWNSGSDSNSGSGWDKAFKSITQALSVAPDDAIIVVGRGVYLEGATLQITQDGLKLLGVMSSGHQWGQPSIHTHGTETLIKIDSPNGQTELAYLGFHDQGAGISLEIAHSANTWRNHVHHCYFGGNATALWAIVAGNEVGSGVGDAHTVDAPTTIIEDCAFMDYATGSVFADCGYMSIIRRNHFRVRAAAHGVRVYNNTTSRPMLFVVENRFASLDVANAIGIQVQRTPAVGYLMIDENKFVNFADNNHCISKRTGYTGLNYLGLTAIAIT
jgi:hypothetical protein